MEIVEFGGWKRCLRLTGGGLELVATLEVGPRILRYGFEGEKSPLCVVERNAGQTGGDHFRMYGGHRFWVSPEDPVRTYFPDNRPVEIVEQGEAVVLRAPVEESNGLQKDLSLRMDETGRVFVGHVLTNTGDETRRVACWALTVMTAGGRGIVPQEPFRSHGDTLLPARPLVLWPYVNMADPRWLWGQRYVQLRQEPVKASQKIGVLNSAGWMAYAWNGLLFIKRAAVVPGAEYPDFNSSQELYTNDYMLELETLSPLEELKPGACLEHVEEWSLHHEPVGEDEAEITAKVLPLV